MSEPTPVPGAERLREIASAHRRHATICRWTANEEDAAEHERMADDLRALAAVFAQIPAPAEPTAVGRGDGLGEDFWACAKFVARLRSTLSPEPPDHAD